MRVGGDNRGNDGGDDKGEKYEPESESESEYIFVLMRKIQVFREKTPHVIIDNFWE